MQPLPLTMMGMSHVLVVTDLDQEMKVLNAPGLRGL